MYLTGAKNTTVDAKQRVTLPADLRKQLGPTVHLIRQRDALYGFAPAEYEAWVDSFFNHDGGSFNPRNRKDVQLRTMLAGHTLTVDIDSAGRLALGKLDATDPSARSALGLEREVTIVGAIDHFEVWNTERWHAEQENYVDALDALMFDEAE